MRNEQDVGRAEAVASAARAADLAKARYDVGIIMYLEVVDADRTLLEQERLRIQLRGERFTASVRLIKALGGGWEGDEPGSPVPGGKVA